MRKLLLVFLTILMMGNVRYDKSFTPEERTYSVVKVSKDTIPEAFEVQVSSEVDYNYYIYILANKLKVSYEDLFTIMAYETGGTFDPHIRNKKSGAMGLIQFSNSTAKTIYNKHGRKYSSVEELIRDNPTVKDQLAIPTKEDTLGGPVYQYLKRNAPYKNSRDLFLTVFYPSALKMPDNTLLPLAIRKANPGLNTVGDYPKLARKRIVLSKEIIAD